MCASARRSYSPGGADRAGTQLRPMHSLGCGSGRVSESFRIRPPTWHAPRAVAVSTHGAPGRDTTAISSITPNLNFSIAGEISGLRKAPGGGPSRGLSFEQPVAYGLLVVVFSTVVVCCTGSATGAVVSVVPCGRGGRRAAVAGGQAPIVIRMANRYSAPRIFRDFVSWWTFQTFHH